MALKKNENKEDVELTLSQKQRENGQIYDCNPYIMFVFVFTALTHCTHVRLCIHCSDSLHTM